MLRMLTSMKVRKDIDDEEVDDGDDNRSFKSGRSTRILLVIHLTKC